ncbi:MULTISPECIES: IS3 family transposase [Streptococcus]
MINYTHYYNKAKLKRLNSVQYRTQSFH